MTLKINKIDKQYLTENEINPFQTHLCESLAEIERALELFPEHKNYAEIYAATGLLTPKVNFIKPNNKL